MKIISKFHDYYDTALGHGFDPHVIYERKTSVLTYVEKIEKKLDDFKPWRSQSTRQWPNQDKGIYYTAWCLLFCGKPYHFYLVRPPADKGATRNRFYCYSPDTVADAIAGCKRESALYETKQKKGSWRAWRHMNELYRENVEERFAESLPHAEIEDLHRSLRSPVLLIQTRRNENKWVDKIIVRNPILKDINFFKVKDSYTTFQEISMYMGGVLGRPEMVHAPIPNDIKRDMAGFDKHSFKQTPPGQKKARRRSKKKRKAQRENKKLD